MMPTYRAVVDVFRKIAEEQKAPAPAPSPTPADKSNDDVVKFKVPGFGKLKKNVSKIGLGNAFKNVVKTVKDEGKTVKKNWDRMQQERKAERQPPAPPPEP